MLEIRERRRAKKNMRKARETIGSAKLNLVNRIHARYSQLNLESDEWPKDKREKLSGLIDMVNGDKDLYEILGISAIIRLFEGPLGTGISFGTTLCYSPEGLKIHSWDEVKEHYPADIPANAESLAKYNTNADEIRRAISDFSDEEKFIQHVIEYS